MTPNPRLALTLALLLAGAAAGSLSATSFLPTTDAQLADSTPVIAEVVVLSAGPAPTARPQTDYLVRVETTIKGHLSGSVVVVRVLGGERPGGYGLTVFGAPRFAEGDRPLLFLGPRADGTYGISQLMLGAFYPAERGGRRFALRRLEGSFEVAPETGKAIRPAPRARDYGRFVSWLQDRARGIEREEDYGVELPAQEIEAMVEAFTLIRGGGGLKMRWFDFEEGISIPWRSGVGGPGGLAGGGVAEIRRALGTWNTIPQTNIDMVHVGTTTNSTGFTAFDGENVILFDDPNDEVEGNCANGFGVLAAGGPWTAPGFTAAYNGEQHLIIGGADIVFNDGGLGCRFGNSKTFEEVAGHELGHTLGFGHSCGDSGSPPCGPNPVLDDALMRAFVHGGGRGAQINSDDRAAARALYRVLDGGGGGPTAPAGLAVELDGLDALLTWEDRSANEDGFRVFRGTGGPLAAVAELPAGAVAYRDEGLVPETTYTYQVASVRGNQLGRSANVMVTTPPLLPVTVALELLTAAPAAGSATELRAVVTGPVEALAWDFGAPGNVGFANAPCAGGGGRCATHIFPDPGTFTVAVTAIGDLGQTAEASLEVTIAGPAAPFTAAESFIQSVIFGPRGATGTFQSNLWLHNAGGSPTLVEASFLRRGIANPDPPERFLTLAAGQSVFLPNVLAGLFGEEDTTGSIRLRHLQPDGTGEPDVRAISRSFVELGAGGIGSFGQFVGDEPEARHTAAEKVVTGILEGDAFISTLLAANVDDAGGRVEVELFDAAGASLGEPAGFALPARSMRQNRLTQLFPGAVDREGPFTARFSSPAGRRFVASATLLEAGSEDQIFVPAEEPATAGETSVFLPRVTRAQGQFGVFLVSQLVAYNPAAEDVVLDLELWLRGQENLFPAERSVTVPAGEVLLVEDLISDLFGMEEATGALKVSWPAEVTAPPKVLSYAFAESTGPTASLRYGMLVNSRPAADATGAEALDFGAELSSLFQASYGAVNLNLGATRVELALKDENGTVLATKNRTLRAQQHLELNLAGLFDDAPIGSGSNWRVETTVLTGGPVLTYLANINASGDIFFVPGRSVE